MKKLTSVPFLQLESIPSLIKDFLAHKIPGYKHNVFSPENIAAAAEQKCNVYTAEQRETLCRALKAQYADLDLSEKQRENLSALAQLSTVTITTGHQLNLFSGPAFFIYKILQTIRTAEDLSKTFPERRFVPIFWMATEDHDFEEINHFQTAGHYYEINAKSGGAVGRIVIEDDYFISRFEDEFRDTLFGTELIQMLKRAYKKGNTLAQATRLLVQELFADYGLLALDGDDAMLKRSMHDIFKDELLNNSLEKTTRTQVEFLTANYGKVQVNPRDINLFYLSETRNRIERIAESYHIVDADKSFTEAEILEELQSHPERFSPNALLRPVYQEAVLPNVAYIGGNAEVMYWLELGEYFKHAQLPFPILIPRNSMLMLTKKTLGKAARLEVDVADLFRSFAAVSREKLMADNEIMPMLEQQENALKAQFSKLKEAAGLTDQTFGNLVEAEETRQLKSFGRMHKRLLRAEKRRQAEKLQRLEDLFLTVHPANVWQERTYNFSVFYAAWGREWLYNCYEAMETADAELIIFSI